MALLKTKDIRALSIEDQKAKLAELKNDLMYERGVASMGGAPANPGKLRAIRTNIARLKTIEREAKK
ncbi:MAG: 50S ribosomal protein L29 [Methanobacteriota archaeon]